MRLIDADALKETICNNVYPVADAFNSRDYGMFWTGGIEKAIDEQPTIGEWIPCSERLPLHGSRVLVTATHKKLGHTAVDVLRYHGDEYGWEGSDFCIVNAWMPLPAIWEEGESNG